MINVAWPWNKSNNSGLRLASLVVLMLGLTMPAHAAELVMFETRGCPWCKLWHQQVGPGYEKSSEGRRAPLRRVDLADVEKTGVALAAPVTASPTFVLADKGKEVGRITGYPGTDFFWGLLGELLNKLDRGAHRKIQKAVGEFV